MTQVIVVHPENPQPRLIKHIIEVLEFGGIIAYPTDSGYALGCEIGNKSALERIRAIRNLGPKHNFTLVCSNLAQISNYAMLDNSTFRLLKACTPGAYTFILPATKEVPKSLQHPKRKTIGIRIPDSKIVKNMLDEFGAPIMSVTLILPGQDMPLANADDIFTELKSRVDLIVDGGFCGMEPTTVVDFSSRESELPVVVRIGKGDPNPFLLSEDDVHGGTFESIFEKLILKKR